MCHSGVTSVRGHKTRCHFAHRVEVDVTASAIASSSLGIPSPRLAIATKSSLTSASARRLIAHERDGEQRLIPRAAGDDRIVPLAHGVRLQLRKRRIGRIAARRSLPRAVASGPDRPLPLGERAALSPASRMQAFRLVRTDEPIHRPPMCEFD